MFPQSHKKWFTLVELIVSILISVLLLGGILFFLTDTLTGLSKSNYNTQFLSQIYTLRDRLWNGNMEILIDNLSWSGSDVMLVEHSDGSWWVIFGIVDRSNLRLSWTGLYDIYHESLLWYRSVSAASITSLRLNPLEVFNLDFFPDKIIPNTYVRDIQVSSYNSGSLHDINFTFFSEYKEQLLWDSWQLFPEDENFNYNIIY